VPEQLYLYGIVEAAGPPLELPAGVADRTPALYVRGDIGAIVSALPEQSVTGRPADARAHEAVLRAAVDRRDAVLPASFGSVFDDVEELESRLLDPEGPALEELLARFGGTVELELRALYPDHEAVLHELVRKDQGLARLSRRARGGGYHAQIELGEAMLAAFERQRDADRDLVVERLAPFAREWRERTDLPERVAAQLAFLVERRRLPELEQAAEKLAESLHERLRLRLIGPLPPYSFVAYRVAPVGMA
jgi:hypothetical protein